MAAVKKGKSADDIRKGVTEQMVEAIKKGTPPWRQPWLNSPNSGNPANFSSGRRYTGINPLILMLFGNFAQGFQSRFWGTGNAWLKETGAHIKKGQHATYVTLYKGIPKKGKDGVVEKTKDGKPKTILIIKEFPVFNVEQLQAPEVKVLLDGRGKFGIVKALLGQFDKTNRTEVTTVKELLQIAKKYGGAGLNTKSTRQEIAEAIHSGIEDTLLKYKVLPIIANSDPDYAPIEELYEKTNANFKEGDRASYAGKPFDVITMPNKRSFTSMSAYYQTASHELIHWVVNGKRIEYTGERDYAFIELVAEIGACFLNIELGVPLAEKMMEKSQGYVANWLKSMGDDPKYIFDAASLASKACDYLLAFIGKANPLFSSEETEGEDATPEVAHQAAA